MRGARSRLPTGRRRRRRHLRAIRSSRRARRSRAGRAVMSSSSRRALPRSRLAPVNEATNASVGRSTSSLGVANWRRCPSTITPTQVGERRGVLEVVGDEDGRERKLVQELLQLRRGPCTFVCARRAPKAVRRAGSRPAARERASERDPLTLAARERRRSAHRRGERCGSARDTRRRAPCPRRRRSAGRSGAGRARTPGRRGRRDARRACERAAASAVQPDVVTERDPPARRPHEPGDGSAAPRSCPHPTARPGRRCGRRRALAPAQTSEAGG